MNSWTAALKEELKRGTVAMEQPGDKLHCPLLLQENSS